MAMEALSIVIEGRVQGVGFRYWTLRLSRSFFVEGWVRNLSDGSVEIFVQGDSSTVKDFAEAVKSGPPHSSVQRVQMIPVTPDNRIQGFSIR